MKLALSTITLTLIKLSWLSNLNKTYTFFPGEIIWTHHRKWKEHFYFSRYGKKYLLCPELNVLMFGYLKNYFCFHAYFSWFILSIWIHIVNLFCYFYAYLLVWLRFTFRSWREHIYFLVKKTTSWHVQVYVNSKQYLNKWTL